MVNITDGQRLQLLIDAIVDYAIYFVEPDGTVASWNSGAARLKGYSAGEIIGRSFSLFYTPEDQAAGLPQKALATATEQGRFTSEGWRVRKDGSRFWAIAVIEAVRDRDGSLIGFAKVTRDVTERQEATQALLESEQRYRRLIEAVVDYAIFQLDATGAIVTWNPGAERIKGYAPEEIIGQHFSRFYTDEDRAAGIPRRALEEAAQNGRFESEGWRVRKDGSRFWASVVIDRIVDESGALVGFAKVTRDISERREAQEALAKVQDQLLASQKLEAVGQLSGGIAHDFNNLLMIVLGNLETIERHGRQLADNAAFQRALSYAKRGAQRAAGLTSRLLAFSRRQALDPKPIDLNNFLNGLQDFLQRTLGERIEVHAIGSAGLWQIEVDPNHLESVIVNLAINARDAMPDGGKLTLEAANISADHDYSARNPELSPGQYVVVGVTDTGVGMSADTLSHAFEPFFTTKEAGQGTGLGLSQLYGFVKQSGGHTKIYSEVGQGTSIKMYFPRYCGAAARKESDEPFTEVASNRAETILVVEDDESLRIYIGDLLRELNYRVLTASNAQTALKILLERRHIDLVLTDVVMPGMNGREFGKRAAEMRPGLKILYMTGYSRNAIMHHGRLDRGVELLEKPVSQAKLALRVREMLDRR
ncbi:MULTISPECIES: PAS domain-containing sensor histidine kinase [unclassified Bradyrhizobium]|uniref:hybrid sensor histidine kinase/response regulator n=1 Tax=unclassified Bradyrhizobium TaxID=2631580 RepID=UPI002479F47E|nr:MULTISPECIES: PAS domain-containing sensor histidine kinase [unclassified Bradyrhizobium]WGS17977.1 PAS domain S-box protein [Bradyrhizobium sp. ISRA463]WGS24784.1 PAS domain S-box protein [Bradyrhizobium sp. ISRA464]